MPKSIFTSKTGIAFTAIMMAIAGIVADRYNYSMSYITNFIKDIASFITFNWIPGNDVFSYNLGLYINLFFYALLFAGGVLYYTSNQKETRLIRFGFSVIFFNRLMVSLFHLANYILTIDATRPGQSFIGRLLSFTLYTVVQVAIIWLAYKILRYFREVKEPQIETIVYGDSTALSYSYPGKGPRIFHMLVDNLVSLLIFTTILTAFIGVLRYRSISHATPMPESENFIPALIYLFCRLSYYFVFESFFGSTPGKMLAENMVLDEAGERPAVGVILKRSVARFIPFDSLSFLGGNGWHDNLSRTSVVAEKPTGVKGSAYFLIIPISIAAVIVYYVGINTYTSYREGRFKQENLTNKIKEFDDKLAHLSDKDYLELVDKDGYQPYGNLYLKVQSVNNNEIVFTKINLGKEFSETAPDAESYYLAHRDSLKQIKRTKSQVRDAIMLDDRFGKSVAGLTINGLAMCVKAIYTRGQPAVSLNHMDGYGDKYVSIGLVNNGWHGTVSSIEVIDGGIIFENIPPVDLPAATQQGLRNSIQLRGTVNGSNNAYKVNITVVDSVGNNKQVYQLTGNTGDSKYRGIKKL